MAITARVFMSGRSQALRLPARLRLQAKEVRVEQIGNDLWLHPETPAEQDMGRWLQQFYTSTEPLPEDFLADRQDAAPQERDWR
ncbi:MAG: AbrB family transcriptional regulator [Betaproteobacteria bacterium]